MRADPSSQHLVQATWPVVVAEVGRDKKIPPVLVGHPEHPLELLPVAACRDHKRSLDSLWILAADDEVGKITELRKHALGTALRKLATNPLGESGADFHEPHRSPSSG